MHRILCTACNRNSTRSFERGHDGNILEEAYRGRYARQRLLNFWPESSCGYHAIKRFVCIIQVEELQRRNYSAETTRLYLFAVKDFATYFGKRPDQLRQEHLRQYQLHLLNDRKLTVDTIIGRIAALRFFFVKVLRRPYPLLISFGVPALFSVLGRSSNWE